MTRLPTRNYQVLRHPSGLIAVDQGQCSGFPISYNPDDGHRGLVVVKGGLE